MEVERKTGFGEDVMRTGIIGIGGVGGYFGGKLAREYANSREHEIIFIARGDHLEAIRENGLRLITPEEEYVVRPNLVTNRPEEVSKLDLIFSVRKVMRWKMQPHSSVPV